jgi:hypothetical protein
MAVSTRMEAYMTFTKLALAVLGTIGLTAGTVLAVAEPTSKPIPAAALADAGACPGSACAKAGCTKSACAVPVAVKAETKCAPCPIAARQTEPLSAAVATEDDAITRPLPAGYSEAPAASSYTEYSPSAKTACDAATRETSFAGLGVNSNAGVSGRAVFAAASESDLCPAAACSATHCADSACEAGACGEAACEGDACPATAQKHTRRLTLGIGISTSGPIIHVATGPNDDSTCESCPQGACSAASLAGKIVASLFGSTSESACNENACEASRSITATACEAKPVAADHAFPICTASACAAAKCCDEASEVAASCATCKCCTCGDCECESSEDVAQHETPADHHQFATKSHTFNINGRRVTVGTHVRHDNGDRSFYVLNSEIQGTSPVGDDPPLPIPRFQTLPHEWANELQREELERVSGGFNVLMGNDPAGNVPPVICPGESEIARNYDSYRLDPQTAREAAGRVHVTHVAPGEFHPPMDVQFFAAHPEIGPGQRIRLSGFAAPVAAPLPPRMLPSRLEGTWTRTIAGGTTEFTHHNGRISGRWQITNGVEVRFSGSCSVLKDDQFVGVIDEIEMDTDASEAFHPSRIALQRLIDQPFAARLVVDGDSLIIKDFRCSGLSPNVKDEKQTSDLLDCVRAFACGRFERGLE